MSAGAWSAWPRVPGTSWARLGALDYRVRLLRYGSNPGIPLKSSSVEIRSGRAEPVGAELRVSVHDQRLLLGLPGRRRAAPELNGDAGHPTGNRLERGASRRHRLEPELLHQRRSRLERLRRGSRFGESGDRHVSRTGNDQLAIRRLRDAHRSRLRVTKRND
jgi:hypothetical protein